MISTAGSNHKVKYIRNIGADHVVLHDSNLYKNLKRYLGKEKINVVFEHIGEKTWETSMKVLEKGGRLVTCGATTGSNVNINLAHLFFKNLSISRGPQPQSPPQKLFTLTLRAPFINLSPKLLPKIFSIDVSLLIDMSSTGLLE